MTGLDDDAFRVVSWNVEHNGTSNSGDDAKWHLAMDVLAELRPHVLLRQELTRADMFGGRAVWAEAARVGSRMIPFLARATRESANPTGVYVDRNLLRPIEFFEHRTSMWHPICNPVVQLSGAARRLSLASFHLCAFSPANRAVEAHRLVSLGKPGLETIIGGDCNSYPHRTADEMAPLPDWNLIKDRSHFLHRTIERNGTRLSDTVPDEILAGEHDGWAPVFVDLAHHAATVLGQPEALAPTASLWRQDQGPRQRIDRLLATPRTAQALTRVEVIATDEVVEVSDHALVMATFSLHGLRRALSPATHETAVAA
ncbi:exonuclease/endonuclease/phosphatase family protein [Streptomyces phaeochromogenes]|uniref:endonuclease/exonuclease/phosphatase family protein n=1 Tax=Streptomyces phaeochromogenes TaxID=1923 RepID=UPI0037236F3B